MEAVFGVALVAVAVAVRQWRRRVRADRRVRALSHLEPELEATRAEREELAEEDTRAAILESVDEQRAALLRSVSHDLRTPLATVRAVVSDLLSGPSHDDATRHELLSLVADETERLDRLFADRRVELDVADDLPLVDGDHTLVEQVVANLLENAARHGHVGSTIRVGARPVKDGVETWVDDEGAGIPPFERHRIFEPFRRSEGSGSSGSASRSARPWWKRTAHRRRGAAIWRRAVPVHALRSRARGRGRRERTRCGRRARRPRRGRRSRHPACARRRAHRTRTVGRGRRDRSRGAGAPRDPPRRHRHPRPRPARRRRRRAVPGDAGDDDGADHRADGRGVGGPQGRSVPAGVREPDPQEAAGRRRPRVVTEPGVGYRLVDPTDPTDP